MLGRYWALADMGGSAFRRPLAFLAVVVLCGTSYASGEEDPDVIPIDHKVNGPVSDVPSNSSGKRRHQTLMVSSMRVPLNFGLSEHQ